VNCLLPVAVNPLNYNHHGRFEGENFSRAVPLLREFVKALSLLWFGPQQPDQLAFSETVTL